MYVDIYTLLNSFSAAQKKVGISKLEPASLQILSMGTTTILGTSVFSEAMPLDSVSPGSGFLEIVLIISFRSMNLLSFALNCQNSPKRCPSDCALWSYQSTAILG